MTLPRDPHIWPEPWHHDYHERVAICMFDAGMSEDEAREFAEADTRRRAEILP